MVAYDPCRSMNHLIISFAQLIYLVDDMTSGYVRRNVMETTGYRKLGVRDGRKTRRGVSARYAQLQAKSGVYVLGNDDSSEDELCNEGVFELAPRNRQQAQAQAADESLVTWVEISPREGDTLTSVALRYHCKISDLKRLNKLMKDQDFFGLRRIRVPVVRHGNLEEQIQNEDLQNTQIGTTDSYAESNECRFVIDDDSDDSDTKFSKCSQLQEAQQLLLRYDENIESTLASTKLEHPDIDIALRPPLNRQISKSLNWRTVLLFFVTFCVVIPIIGGLYFIFKHLGY